MSPPGVLGWYFTRYLEVIREAQSSLIYHQ